MAIGALVLTLVLSLLRMGSGQWQVMGPDKPVQVMVGEDAVFSCFLSPKTSAEAMEVRFFKDNFNVMVHVYREGKDQHYMQMSTYQGRTELLKDFIEEGRVSLRLKKVTLLDIGLYGCWFSFQDNVQEAMWSLQVSALGSAPLVSLMGYADGGIQLLCNSSGWFPQPTVKWKDLQGHDLPSDPKGNADIHSLFGVETSLIVQENAGSILCSIQYSDHSPEMESRVWIRESFFHPIRWGLLCILLGIIFLFLFVGIIVLSRSFYKLKGKIWAELKWRRNQGVSELREAQKYAVEVTLDPETAHPQLHVSDLKTVCYKNIHQDVTNSDKRFARKCVVASQSFQAGKHYWEVDVGYNKMWWVGVCHEYVDRKVGYVVLSPNNGYWVFGRKRKEYFTFETGKITLHPRTPPTRVGIFLDCEGETISFFNINDQSLIHTLRCKFEGLLRPYIQHYGSHKKNETPIVICPVSPRPEKEEPSDTDNLDPRPQVTTPFLPRWCSKGIIPHTLPQETELPLRPQSPAAESAWLPEVTSGPSMWGQRSWLHSGLGNRPQSPAADSAWLPEVTSGPSM